jgi:hypothetical protein
VARGLQQKNGNLAYNSAGTCVGGMQFKALGQRPAQDAKKICESALAT